MPDKRDSSVRGSQIAGLIVGLAIIPAILVAPWIIPIHAGEVTLSVGFIIFVYIVGLSDFFAIIFALFIFLLVILLIVKFPNFMTTMLLSSLISICAVILLATKI